MFRDLIGIPFVDGKTDCWWLVREGFKRFGIVVPDYNIAMEAVEKLSFDPSEVGRIIWEQRRKWKRLEEPKIPCLLLMSLGCAGALHHLALYIGKDKMLHTIRKQGSCIERLNRPLYATREKSYWEYVG
jgi:cell wall-associated NlpC family hydrolase